MRVKHSTWTVVGLFWGIAAITLLVTSEQLALGVESLFLQETRAVVTRAARTQVTSTDADGNTEVDDAADISFRYWVDNQERLGSGGYLSDPTPKTSIFTNVDDLLRTYAAGTETTAYYDPDAPERACLRAGFGPADFALCGFILFLVGAGAFALRRGRKG